MEPTMVENNWGIQSMKKIIFDNHNQSIPMNSNKLIDTDFQELINV